MNKKIRTPFSGLIDSVWKIRSRHFLGLCSRLDSTDSFPGIDSNMSYIRPESFYLLHPRSRGPHGTAAMDGGSVEMLEQFSAKAAHGQKKGTFRSLF